MRHVEDLEAWIAERRLRTHLIAEVADAPRVPRTRPRSAEAHAVLEITSLASVAASRASGQIVQLGPRRYALHDVPRLQSARR